MPHTQSDDTRIYYEAFGDPGHPTIVLISGGGAQLLSWHEDFVDRLVEAGFQVVRFDNRDTGLSARFGSEDDVDGGYGIPEMGGDILRILDDLGVAAAHLVGHSMGGIIAEMTVLDAPERVKSLTLISTIPGQDPRYVLHDSPVIAPPPRVSREVAEAAAIEYAIADSTGRYDPQVEWHRQRAVEAYTRGYAPDGFVRQWSALLRAPERLERLREVTVPALLFHGRDDRVLHWSAAVDTAAAIPGSELQVHPDMGHLIPWELWPELIAGIVRAARRGEERAAG